MFRGYLRPELFDAAGEGALASTIDTKAIEVSQANVVLAYAREARRAAKRGDGEKARELAKTFVEAWGTADVKVPAVDELRPLLAP